MPTLTKRRAEPPVPPAGSCHQTPPAPVVAAKVRYSRCRGRKRPLPPVQTLTPKSIAANASRAPEIPQAALARALLLQAWRASAAAIRVPRRASACGRRRNPACARIHPARARGRAAAPGTAGRSFHPDGSSLVLSSRSRSASRGQRARTLQRLPQFVPRAQQHHAYKGPPHAQRIRNFVVTHVRVIAHHQRHTRPPSQLVQRLADLLAGALLDQPLELIRVRVFQRHAIYVFALFILPDLSPRQRVPAIVCRHLVQPRRKRPALVVLH